MPAVLRLRIRPFDPRAGIVHVHYAVPTVARGGPAVVLRAEEGCVRAVFAVREVTVQRALVGAELGVGEHLEGYGFAAQRGAPCKRGVSVAEEGGGEVFFGVGVGRVEVCEEGEAVVLGDEAAGCVDRVRFA